MGKKRKRLPQERGTVFEPGTGAPTRWRSVDPAAARGRLRKVEEMEIAKGIYPEKDAALLKAEADARAQRVDPAAPADHTPMRLSGPGGLSEHLLRRLSGESAMTADDHRLALLWREYQRTNPIGCALLHAHRMEQISIRELASGAGISPRSIARMIVTAELQFVARYQTLYPQPT